MPGLKMVHRDRLSLSARVLIWMASHPSPEELTFTSEDIAYKFDVLAKHVPTQLAASVRAGLVASDGRRPSSKGFLPTVYRPGRVLLEELGYDTPEQSGDCPPATNGVRP
jgi:hypothetical protein